jgi:Acetyltransferase (GNAT) domain
MANMTGGYHYPPPERARIVPRTESSHAARLAASGSRIRLAHGRYWMQRRSGFYDTVHWLARLTLDEARLPGPCWGYRAALVDEQVGDANGVLAIHLMRDLEDYSEARLRKDARRALKRLSTAGVEIVNVTDDHVFVDQGYEVMLDWRARVGATTDPPPRERYFTALRDAITDEASLVLAAMDKDRLLGYVIATVVDGSAHLLESKIRSDALRLGVGIGLDHQTVLALQRSGVVREISAGPHQPELPSVTAYKTRYGFPIVHLPTRVCLPGVLGRVIAKHRPFSYYRLTGRLPEGTDCLTED